MQRIRKFLSELIVQIWAISIIAIPASVGIFILRQCQIRNDIAIPAAILASIATFLAIMFASYWAVILQERLSEQWKH